MASCKPCHKLTEELELLKGEGLEFSVENFDIEEGPRTERFHGKRILTKWAAKKVPFLLLEVNGVPKKALYTEEGITMDMVRSAIVEIKEGAS